MSARTRQALLALAVLGATASTVWSVKRAAYGSKDFQWSPTHLMLEGRNPFNAFLAGSPDIILTQAPNYLHTLYFVLIPFGLVSFSAAKIAWVLINIALATAAVVIIGNAARWSRYITVLVTAVLLMSTPARIGLSNGQHAVLLLMMAIFAFTYTTNRTAFFPVALLVTKYSFSPLLILLLARRGWKAVALGLLTTVLAALIFWRIVGGSFVDAAFGPLRTARISVAPGVGDFMTIVQQVFNLKSSNTALFVVGIASATVLSGIVWKRASQVDWLESLAIGALISLISFKHLTHDFVFLLPVIVVALRCNGWRRRALLGILLYQWFILGAMSQIGIPGGNTLVVISAAVTLGSALWVIATRPLNAPDETTLKAGSSVRTAASRD